MAYVNVPNDLSRIKTKLAFNLTKRQLVCFGTAAVIGIPHSKWVERPLGCVVVKPGSKVSGEELRTFLKDKVKVAWWIPDRFAFLDQIPKTSVGKFSKKELREMFASGRLSVPEG